MDPIIVLDKIQNRKSAGVLTNRDTCREIMLMSFLVERKVIHHILMIICINLIFKIPPYKSFSDREDTE